MADSHGKAPSESTAAEDGRAKSAPSELTAAAADDEREWIAYARHLITARAQRTDIPWCASCTSLEQRLRREWAAWRQRVGAVLGETLEQWQRENVMSVQERSATTLSLTSIGHSLSSKRDIRVARLLIHWLRTPHRALLNLERNLAQTGSIADIAVSVGKNAAQEMRTLETHLETLLAQ
jgi:hypothetical protein